MKYENYLKNNNNRDSSIELIKIIAMIMIVFSHGMPYGDIRISYSAIQLEQATNNIQIFILGMLHNMGQIGNCIFIIASAWYLLDSNIVKIKKISILVINNFVISLLGLLVIIDLNYELPMKYLFDQLFPTTFGNNWFLTCYILFYVIHPLLNKAITSISRRELLIYNLLLVFLYSIVKFIKTSYLFFYTHLVGFILIYFIVAYAKKYLINTFNNKKNGVYLILIGLVGWMCQNIITNSIGLNISNLSKRNQMWNIFVNPMYILIAMGIFIVAKNYKFYNKTINYLSSLSLLIYIIHHNQAIMNHIRFEFFEFVFDNFTYKYILIWALFFSLILLLFSTVLSVIYNETLHKIVNKFADIISKMVIKNYLKIESKLFKYN